MSFLDAILSGINNALTRDAGDFALLTHKTTPVSGDVLCLEDSESAGAKAYATIAEIAPLVGGSSFDPLTDIAPDHYWRPSDATKRVESGGLVDSLTDFGVVGGKDFASSGAARAPITTDGNGHDYLDPDGVEDTYAAGVANDWQFFNNSGRWTIGMVMRPPFPPVDSEAILCTSNSSNGTGLYLGYTVSTGWGPNCQVWIAGTSILRVTSRRTGTAPIVLIVRCTGAYGTGISAAEVSNAAAILRWGGGLHSLGEASGSWSATDPSGALTLFKPPGDAIFTATGIYDLWVTANDVPDRLLLKYEEWAAATYQARG